MRSSKFPVVPTLLFAGLVAAAIVDCGGDDTSSGTGSGGSAGTSSGAAGKGGSVAGSSGTAGGTAGTNGGSSGDNTAGMGGTGGAAGGAGAAGKAGSGGAPEAGPDVKADVVCNIPGVNHTAPTVPAGIALPVTGAVLLGGYRAVGDQIYTCAAGPDAGADASDSSLTGTWVNTAEATVYGDACAKFADHAFPAGSPNWKSVDGSAVTATKDSAVDPPSDGGAAVAIKWVRLKATGTTGEGYLANVTWVHRVNTTGGLQPSAACDPSKAADAGGVVRVPYTADYFFYTGGTSTEAGSEPTTEAGSDASDDGSDSGG